MITLSENAKHQLTVAGTGMLAEARAGHVNYAGLTLLDVPDVIDNGDGSFTLRLAVLDAPAYGKRANIQASGFVNDPIARAYNADQEDSAVQ